MHDEIINGLESHLEGRTPEAFRKHLEACAECRVEVAELDRMENLLSEFRAEAKASPEPSPYFYNGVARRIVEQERSQLWGFFTPGAAFFRKIAFASLLAIAALGTWLANREAATSGTDAAAVMAQHDATVDHSDASDRDMMLAALSGYR